MKKNKWGGIKISYKRDLRNAKKMVFLDWLTWITRTNNKDGLVIWNIEIDDRSQSNVFLVPIKRTRFVCVTVVPVPWFTVCLCTCCHHCLFLRSLNMLFVSCNCLEQEEWWKFLVIVLCLFVCSKSETRINQTEQVPRSSYTHVVMLVSGDILLGIIYYYHFTSYMSFQT